MEVFNSDHGSNILGCGNLCTAGSQIFKTKEFTWFSEVKYFQCISLQSMALCEILKKRDIPFSVLINTHVKQYYCQQNRNSITPIKIEFSSYIGIHIGILILIIVSSYNRHITELFPFDFFRSRSNISRFICYYKSSKTAF